MATLLLQFCLVSAVGYYFGPASALTSTSRALSVDSSPPLPSASLNQLSRQNVSLRFVDEPSDVFVARGKDAILHCEAESTRGNVTITWFYENISIPDDDARWSVGSQGTELRVLQVAGGKRATAKSNAGEYSCIARNEAGALSSRTARVRVAIEKDVSVLPENLTIYESQPMLLHCSVHSTPPAEIQWEVNQLPLPKDKRYVPLPNGALLIIDTKFTDSGSYRCIAENSIIKKPKLSKNVEINILPPPRASIPPTFLLINSSINRTALIGETVEFFCVTTGWPIPTVQWINNKNVTLSNSSTLTIRNAHPKDTGYYTCIAKNSQGQAFQKFHLDVYQKPFFNTTPTSSSAPPAKTVRLECQAKGIPQPRVSWLKNGKPLVAEPRIKKQSTGLVFSDSVSKDSGIYQCVATNAVGTISAAAQVEIDGSKSPNPPQDVKCRPFNEDSVCITWKNPPNVSVQAHSVYSYYTDGGNAVSGPEYLGSKETFQLADGLKHSTNYTFYVKLYSRHASDHSEKVTCQPGLTGFRNLDINVISSTSVMVQWDNLSSDTLCNGTTDPFMVQWFRDGDESHLSTGITTEQKFNVTGLVPATDYQFRVLTLNNPQDEPWILYSLPDIQITGNDTLESTNELRAPKYLHEDFASSASVKISWERVLNAKFYTVCYVPAKEGRECHEDDFIKSYSPKFSISKLKPNTEYLFRVRAHDANNVPGAISQPFLVRTLADVPSPVVDLQYKALNSSTACIHWRPPENNNGKLKNYVVSYTTDPNWSLENLIEFNVPVYQKKSQSCWEDKDRNSGGVSTLLTNLSSDHTYMVMVRAANDIGLGPPLVSTVVKTFDTTNKANEMVNNPEEAVYKQKIGIILGVILAILCILCCITFILLRRRCLKRRAAARAGLATSSNYRPAVAHFTTQLGSVQVRMEQPCSTDAHEIEHLVSEEQNTHIPPVTPDHLDTKGAHDFPNGHLNGTNKPPPLMNGAVLNGHVHITENPQYYVYECNGNMAKNKSEPLLRQYEEDSNSNVNPTKFRDIYKLFDTSKKLKEPPRHSPYGNGNFYSTSLGSSRDNSLDSTQLTFLDDSIASQRRLSPVLEPNG